MRSKCRPKTPEAKTRREGRADASEGTCDLDDPEVPPGNRDGIPADTFCSGALTLHWENHHVMNPDQTHEERVEPMARKPNLASISPFFIVRDLQASISHYVERFGFQLDFQGPPDGVYYGQVSRDGIGIMLKTIRPDVLPVPNHMRHEWARWDAYIYTLDPDALFAEYKERGVSFVKELSFIDDGLWGFEATDADGYVLAFFRTRDE